MCFSQHIAVSIAVIKNSRQVPFNLKYGDKLASNIHLVDNFLLITAINVITAHLARKRTIRKEFIEPQSVAWEVCFPTI